MKTIYRSGTFLLLLIATFGFIPSRVAAEKQKLRFSVTLSATLASEPVSGRLIVFMTNSSEPLQVIEPSLFDLEKVWVAAKEVHNLTPGKAIEFDPDELASPAPLSSAQPGDYQVMALLDVDHSYSYSGMGSGDLRSEVIRTRGLTPSESEPVQLTLAKRVEDQHPISDTENTKLITFQSPSLTAFWGRPVVMRAGVLLPPSYPTSKLRYPVIYRVHGFAGSYRSAWTSGAALYKKMADNKLPEMINVYLDGACPLGHHEFADSVNNGPWGQALIKEFIPYLEQKFRMDGGSRGRFLTGHSSGGWSTLWLQVNYPDVFGGTWSTSPDPVDFRSFSGLDLTRYPADNFYRAGGRQAP